jgi:SAM-dependent methyltransferase
MKNVTKFYEDSIKKNKPSPLLAKFFGLNLCDELPGRTAIDIGCGAGNDTIFLLNKGFKVIAIDVEPQVKDLITNRINDEHNLKIIIDDFSKIQLHPADLMFGNYSLFFAGRNFDRLMKNILENLNQNGFFVGNFLGKEDAWKECEARVDKDELFGYFSDFKIMYFSEEKYYKDSSSEKNKFWHVYTIIAQKLK